MKEGKRNVAQALAWAFVAFSVLTLIVFGSLRLTGMGRDPATADAFDARYLRHPVATWLHVVPGLAYFCLAPLQFVPAIRRRWLDVHRVLGRILVACALVTGVFAIVVAVRLPAFGGVSTLAATLLFGALFVVSILRAFQCVRRGDIGAHREWMIRAFALALGAASIRIYIGLFAAFSTYSTEQIFGLTFWLGFGINLIVAEGWVRSTSPSR